MAKVDEEYQKLCRKILSFGKEYHNKRRNAKRLQIPSYNFKHSFADGFPAITNKKLFFRSIVGELLWFLRGDNDITWLNDNKIDIWNKDAFNWHKKFGGTYSWEQFNAIGQGSTGQNYSKQWRNYNGNTDQIMKLVADMKSDIMGSRLKVTAWNPTELDKTALPPCHTDFQVVGIPLGNDEFGFELHWSQRSTDVFLGLPFDVATFGLLAKILEAVTGFKALGIEGNLKCVHFYDNQYEAAKELLNRSPRTHGKCELIIKEYIPQLAWINFDRVIKYLEIDDFELIGYTSDPAIPVEMLAPTEI